MYVLGIGGSAHDFSSCLVKNGTVVAAIEEERLSRVKYHPLGTISRSHYRLRSVDYCLDVAGIGLADVDRVVANDIVFPLMLRGLRNVERIGHHQAHAAATYFLSPHRDCAVLVIDGAGSVADGRAETVSYFRGSGRNLDRLWQATGKLLLKDETTSFSWGNFDSVEDSIGILYSYVTDLIGFGSYEEGKTMGLAPYGDASSAKDLLRMVPVGADGSIRFGPVERSAISELYESRMSLALTEADVFQARADLARAAQALLEDVVLRHATNIHSMTGADTLCVSGGIFMNCPANYRLLKEGPFERVFIHGASGDNGTSLGAALHGYHQATAGPCLPSTDPVIYTGRSYSDSEILAALRERASELTFRHSDSPASDAAELLAAGKVIGWFQGASEFGARALGNRSILADPRNPGMKDLINAMVKGREKFRPFAPSVLAERQDEFYDVPESSPYMCLNAMAREGGRSIPAVTHVDGSGRIQTVRKDLNPLYHELLTRLEALSGVGVLLNTSFNEQEPIVETPAQAVDCFLRTGMDRLVIGPFLVSKTADTIESE